MSEKKNRGISLRETIEEFREKYKKNPVNHDWKDIDLFFKESNKTLSYYLELILSDDYNELNSMQFEWSIVGSFFELIVKVCLLKKAWGNLGIIFDAKNKKYHMFSTCKDLIVEDLELTVEKKKIERVRDIFDIIILQRNNSLHNPISMCDHYRLEEHVLELILLLNAHYKIGFSNEIVVRIKDKMEKCKKQSGLNFEEVDLMEGFR